MTRIDGRQAHELRPTRITRKVLAYAEGSALIEMGHTRVICSASIEERVPPFLMNRGTGWLTGEYGMLPRSTQVRTPRPSMTGRPRGRTYEVQRLIGRSLRAVLHLDAIGPRTIQIDCDVLQADGGTRTAAITGAYVALCDAISWMRYRGLIKENPIVGGVAAVSVGLIEGEAVLDLCYDEDASADVDMNVVMSDDGRLIEVQGTAEGEPFTRAQMNTLLDLAQQGIQRLLEIQQDVLGEGEARST